MAKYDKNQAVGGGGNARPKGRKSRPAKSEPEKDKSEKAKDKKAKSEKAKDKKAKSEKAKDKKAKSEKAKDKKGKDKKGKDKKGKDKKGKDKKGKLTRAERADRHDLYQRAVQAPEADVEFFDRVFRRLRGRKPLSLREDFCGTALLSCMWVESDPERRAIGVDLDAPTLDWAREHNLSRLEDDQRGRVVLHEANVLDGRGDRADIVCAMNFSYNVFKAREDLKRYLEVVHDRLEDDGVLFTEMYGGLEAVVELEEERDCDGFTYVWDQDSFNPINHETVCHIHFGFSDGSKLRRAFTYDWRLWTLPELRDLLHEVGFSDVQVYWEETDAEGEGTGEFHPTEHEENQEAWLVYIVATK